MSHQKLRLLKITSVSLLLLPYLIYVGLILYTGQGPVDYETFLDIGNRLLTGSQIYGENSYYPMPYVMLFSIFSWLPRSISVVIWFLAPVITALLISRGNPFVLLFAPVIGHFVGGQTAIFGMLGLWGYRRYRDNSKLAGGIFLSLTLLKPQLGIIPLAYAGIQWWQYIRHHKRIARQAWAFLAATIAIYLPGFLIFPNWVSEWLSTPRPLSIRAMSAFVPRTLLTFISGHTVLYWGLVIVIALILLIIIWRLNRRTINLDLAVLWGFIVSPLVHDYDLIQLIPILEKPKLQTAAVLLSIPGWLVILFAYGNDTAWYVFSLIAPGLVCTLLYLKQKALTLNQSRGELG